MSGKQTTDDEAPGLDLDAAMETLAEDLFSSDEGESGDDNGGSLDLGDSASDSTAGTSADRGKVATPVVPPAEGETGQTAGTTATVPGTNPGNAGVTPVTTGAGSPGSPDQPPASWTQEAKEHWKTIPSRIQQEILKREDDFFKGIEQYKGEAGIGRHVKEVLNPYLPTMRQYNIEPMGRIQELLQMNYEMATGSAQRRAEIVSLICKTWQVDPTMLITEEAYLDPAVAGLKKELGTVTTALDSMRRSDEARIREANLAEVNSFLADPANVYVQEVVNDMTDFLNKGVCKTLKEAYEKAVWTNPMTRAKETARMTAEATSKREKEEADRAAAARGATAANVTTKGRSGRPPETGGSIDDTIGQTLKAIRGRK